MRKLVLAMFTGLDGYITGPGGELIRPQWSDDLTKHWSGYSLERAAHLLYGRVNFLLNKGFWEPAATDPNSPASSIPYAPVMNRLVKTVVSDTLTGDPGWNGKLVRGAQLKDAVAELKSSAPGDIYSFGGAGLAHTLVSLDLVDEYRVMICPTLFGGGQRLFSPGFERQELELIESRPLDTGAVVLHYRRKRD
jgi:dihydrofolate reductase